MFWGSGFGVTISKNERGGTDGFKQLMNHRSPYMLDARTLNPNLQARLRALGFRA